MFDKTTNTFPFLTRDMLKYGRTVEIGISVTTQNTIEIPLFVTVLTRSGYSTFKATGNGDGEPNTDIFKLDDIPIMVSLSVDSNDCLPGEFYASCELVIAGNILHTLCAGYVYFNKSVSYPTANTEPVINMSGGTFTVTVPDPAAGADLNYPIPSWMRYRIIAMSFDFTTSAAVASRYMKVSFATEDGMTVVATHNFVHLVGVARHYTVAHFGAYLADAFGGYTMVNIPADLWLDTNGSIKTIIEAIQAGDQIANVRLLVQRCFTPDQ